jgi:hypothetical protein
VKTSQIAKFVRRPEIPMLDRATIVKDGKVIQRSLRRGDKIE